MALHFSANQYDKQFQAKRLQNWEVPKSYRERPRPLDGFTQIISNNRGHLLPGVQRSYESPWGQFVGTWEMPRKIPGNNISNPTARSSYAIEELAKLKIEGDERLKGKPMIIRSAPASRQSMTEQLDFDKSTQTADDKGIQVNLCSSRSGAKGVTPRKGSAAGSDRAGTAPGSARSSKHQSPVPQTMSPVSQANAPIASPQCD
ncbi:protein Flattop-like [Tubulanus polymorphus]|uniref:protein Flattop-like n=1 Tax=Tubulanus polymorphus TaxID=672921 RepID=UPI003DA2BDBC